MKVIVTGAGGFVGRSFTEELLCHGHHVTALIRSGQSESWFRNRGINHIMCSLSEYPQLSIQPEIENADVFFHFAWDGTSGPKRTELETQMKNVTATRDAVELAHRCGCRRFVFAGSIMEYEAMEYLGSDHAVPPAPYIYSCQKLAGDYIAKIEACKIGLEYITLIISNIFGPGENSPRFINTLVNKMINDEYVALTDGKQQYDFIYISDAVRAIYLAGIKGNSNCSYYIGNTEQKSLREYVEAAKTCIRSHSVLDFGAIPYYGPMSAYQRVDTKKLEREFQFRPKISFREGIKKILIHKENML